MTAPVVASLATGRWRHVSSRSSAGFTVRNFGLKVVAGTVPVVQAYVDVDATGRPHHVHAVLDLQAIDTGNRRREADLRKPHLLGTDEHPTLTFSGTPEPNADGWDVRGRLAGRGIAELTLRAEIVDRAASGELTVHATAIVDRRELGVRAPRFLIGHRLTLEVNAVFSPPR
jgi:polyisoprenoid-binding protein YceI